MVILPYGYSIIWLYYLMIIQSYDYTDIWLVSFIGFSALRLNGGVVVCVVEWLLIAC